jgi:hypothetical protein
VAAPANDDFANAELITGASGSVNGTNVDSTLEVDDGGFIGTVWYEWVAPTTGPYTFTVTSAMPGYLIIWTGSVLGSLTSVAYGGDGTTNLTVSLDAIASTSYKIDFDGWDTGDFGAFTLGWGAVVPEGVCVAFGNNALDPNPTWVRLDA